MDEPVIITTLRLRFALVLWAAALFFTALDVSAFAVTVKPKTGPDSKIVKSKGAQIVSGSWNLGCAPVGGDKKLLCEASRTIVLKNTGKVLLSVFITPWTQTKATAAYVLRLQLPHGLNLPEGVQIQIDDGEINSPVFQTTNQNGIYARIGLTKKLLNSLQTGKILNVRFSAMNGNKLSIPVSLNGFAPVFARMT